MPNESSSPDVMNAGPAAVAATETALSRLNRFLIEAQERERNRLARELHDDFGQRIALLMMDLARLSEILPDSSVARALLRTLNDQVNTLGRDIQRLSHRLHSAKLDSLGLAAAIDGFCKELSTHLRVGIEYVHAGVPDDLPREMAVNLFRVLQEALSNAIKHSKGRRYIVTLHATSEAIRLDVVDDGCGFDVQSATRGDGLGLASMKERLNLIGGELVVDSDPDRGTRVTARAPLSIEARRSS
jgi:signal transduction histidine kinase